MIFKLPIAHVGNTQLIKSQGLVFDQPTNICKANTINQNNNLQPNPNDLLCFIKDIVQRWLKTKPWRRF
jgi:hypothetical protein